VTTAGSELTVAHALYSLSQDNWAFTRNVISQPAALSELVNIAQQDHAAVSGKGKGKGKANGAVEDDGRGLLTRVLVAGKCSMLRRFPAHAQAPFDTSSDLARRPMLRWTSLLSPILPFCLWSTHCSTSISTQRPPGSLNSSLKWYVIS